MNLIKRLSHTRFALGAGRYHEQRVKVIPPATFEDAVLFSSWIASSGGSKLSSYPPPDEIA